MGVVEVWLLLICVAPVCALIFMILIRYTSKPAYRDEPDRRRGFPISPDAEVPEEKRPPE